MTNPGDRSDPSHLPGNSSGQAPVTSDSSGQMPVPSDSSKHVPVPGQVSLPTDSPGQSVVPYDWQLKRSKADKSLGLPILDSDRKGNLPGFLRYEKKNGVEYARWTKSFYVKDGVTHHNEEYLGKVLNKEAGLFNSRERGQFVFTLSEGYKEPNPSILPTEVFIPKAKELSFGDAWLFNDKIKKLGLDPILDTLIPGEGDTIKALVAFRLLSHDPYEYASYWHKNSYVKLIYPDSNLESSNISRICTRLGEESVYLNFFEKYLHNITENQNIDSKISLPILLDSTKVANAIQSHYTKNTKYSGDSEKALRLIYVVDRRTNLPIFFRTVPGNIIDQTTLRTTINKLDAYNIKVSLIVIDAGYSSQKNLNALCKVGIPFITRMSRSMKKYSELIHQYGGKIYTGENEFYHNGKTKFGIKVPIFLGENEIYAYLIYDPLEGIEKIQRIGKKFRNDIDKIKHINKAIKYAGMFVLLSKQDLTLEETMRLYSCRDKIEKVFSFLKNRADATPVGAHCEKTLRARMLISFIGSIAYSSIHNSMINSKHTASSALAELKYAKINVYPDRTMLEELTRTQKELFQELNIDCPYPEEKGCLIDSNLELAKAYGQPRKPGRPKGSRNKSNMIMQTHPLSEPTNENTRKRGRPPGSKNKARLRKQGSAAGENGEVFKRGRGRPKGSRNKEKPREVDVKRGRGRPKGSRNKEKPREVDIKRGRGRPKGSRNREKPRSQVQTTSAVENGLPVKRIRGRPKKSRNVENPHGQ
jgi:hypothetical protein